MTTHPDTHGLPAWASGERASFALVAVRGTVDVLTAALVDTWGPQPVLESVPVQSAGDTVEGSPPGAPFIPSIGLEGSPWAVAYFAVGDVRLDHWIALPEWVRDVAVNWNTEALTWIADPASNLVTYEGFDGDGGAVRIVWNADGEELRREVDSPEGSGTEARGADGDGGGAEDPSSPEDRGSPNGKSLHGQPKEGISDLARFVAGSVTGRGIELPGVLIHGTAEDGDPEAPAVSGVEARVVGIETAGVARIDLLQLGGRLLLDEARLRSVVDRALEASPSEKAPAAATVESPEAPRSLFASMRQLFGRVLR